MNLAREIQDNYKPLYQFLNWRTYRNWCQLKSVCELIFRHFIVSPQQLVLSAGQLAFRINRVRSLQTIPALIDVEIEGKKEPEEINETIEDVLKFIRAWAQYYFPIYLMTLNRIQHEIYSERNLEREIFLTSLLKLNAYSLTHCLLR